MKIIFKKIAKPRWKRKPSIRVTQTEYKEMSPSSALNDYGSVTILDDKTNEPRMIISRGGQPIYDFKYMVMLVTKNEISYQDIFEYKWGAEDYAQKLLKKFTAKGVTEGNIFISGPHNVKL